MAGEPLPMAQRWATDDFDTGVRIVPQCSNCIWYNPDKLMTCDAFPDGIPSQIFSNEFDHRRAWPGDGGLRYIPLTPTPHPLDGKESDPNQG